MVIYGAELQSPGNSLCLALFASPTYQITRETLSANACKFRIAAYTRSHCSRVKSSSPSLMHTISLNNGMEWTRAMTLSPGLAFA